jgi:hypothetical protein
LLKTVGNTVVRRLHIATLQLDTLSLHLSTADSGCSTVFDSTPEESDDIVLQHRVTPPAGGGGSLRLRGRLAHPDWKLNPEAPSAWSFSLRRPAMDDSSLSVEKGMVGKNPVKKKNPAQWVFLRFFGFFLVFFYIYSPRREFLGFFQFQEYF